MVRAMAEKRLTTLQFAVLHLLMNQDLTGPDLRENLESAGYKATRSALYRLTSRLVEEGWIEGEFETKLVENHPLRTRRYKITGEGRTAYENTAGFLESLPRVGFSFGVTR